VGKKIVSYAYFRHRSSPYEQPKGDAALQFEQFLPLLVRAHHVIWPGWDLMIYHDDHVQSLPYFEKLLRFQDAGLLRLVDMFHAVTLCESMLWRMRPIWYDNAEIVVVRDIDTITSPADRRCVEEFIASGLSTHVVHFASAHSGVMGGTTAVRCLTFRELTGYASWKEFSEDCARRFTPEEWNVQGCDQHFLNRYVLPKVKDSLLLHELHHQVRDMGVPPENIRRVITAPLPGDIYEDALRDGDALSPGIGICEEPAPPLKFYDSLDIPVIKQIQELEKV